MHGVNDEKAAQAKDKKAAIGPDIDLSSFTADPIEHAYLNDLAKLPAIDQQRIIQAGVDATETGRSGTYVQKDTSVVPHIPCRMVWRYSPSSGPARNATRSRIITGNSSPLTRINTPRRRSSICMTAMSSERYREARIIYPVKACLYIDKENLSQYVHNLIIVEEGADLHVITGCAAASHLKRGLHMGISEFFVKKNAKLSFT